MLEIHAQPDAGQIVTQYKQAKELARQKAQEAQVAGEALLFALHDKRFSDAEILLDSDYLKNSVPENIVRDAIVRATWANRPAILRKLIDIANRERISRWDHYFSGGDISCFLCEIALKNDLLDVFPVLAKRYATLTPEALEALVYKVKVDHRHIEAVHLILNFNSGLDPRNLGERMVYSPYDSAKAKLMRFPGDPIAKIIVEYVDAHPQLGFLQRWFGRKSFPLKLAA